LLFGVLDDRPPPSSDALVLVVFSLCRRRNADKLGSADNMKSRGVTKIVSRGAVDNVSPKAGTKSKMEIWEEKRFKQAENRIKNTR
jgi:hypothetical protein